MSWWNKLAESGEGLGLGKLKTLVDSAADTFIPKEDSPRSVSLAEEEIPVTDEVVEYVYNLTEHPATFTDFPISKHTGEERHAKVILSTVPALSDLRYKLCPRKMPEEVFWRIYFLLLLNKTGRKVNQSNSSHTIDLEGMDSRALEKHFEAIIAEQQKLATIEFDEGVDSRMDSYFVQEQEVDVKKRVDEMGRLLTAGGREKREKDAAS